MNGRKLTRKQIAEGLDSVPMDTILLGASSGSALTPSQKEFARNLALGKSKAQSYREAYNSKGNSKTQANHGYQLAKRDDIQAIRDAYALAIDAAKHRTPAQLRELVIHRLTSLAINEEVNPAQQIQALKLLGQVSEVAAFTERKEVHTIKHSEDIRGRLVEQLRALTHGAIDAEAGSSVSRTPDADSAADSLLAELGAAGLDSAQPDPTAPPPPQIDPSDSESSTHTIPHSQSPANCTSSDSSSSNINDLRVSPVLCTGENHIEDADFEMKEGVGGTKVPGDSESGYRETPPASSENGKG